MPGSSQLLGCGKTSGAGSDDRHPSTAARRRGDGGEPAFGPGTFDDLVLDLFYGDRWRVDAEDA